MRIQYFLNLEHIFRQITFSIFALSASYAEDVIEAKRKYENLEQIYPKEQEPARTVLDLLVKALQSGGYLLRTKIRAAIEFLDQLYQYGKAGKTVINELGKERISLCIMAGS